MATTKKHPAAPAKLTVKGRAKQGTTPATASLTAHAGKPGIVLGLYKDRLRIAPDFFEPHEVPPGVSKKAA